MANSLTLSRQQTKDTTTNDIKVQTYWDAVRSKLWHDKIAMLALALGIFMVTITLSASLIGDHLLGFDDVGYPYNSLERNQAKRNRNGPPTWFVEGWATFQTFSNSCLGSDGCQWSLLPEIAPSMAASAAVMQRGLKFIDISLHGFETAERWGNDSDSLTSLRQHYLVQVHRVGVEHASQLLRAPR